MLQTLSGFFMLACFPYQEFEEGHLFDSLYFAPLPPVGHRLTRASLSENEIELEDGTVWKVNRRDKKQLRTWDIDDFVIITQNNKWYSHYHYRIIQHKTGNALECNLFLGSYANNENTQHIFCIDYIGGCLGLMNGLGEVTYWEVALQDCNTLLESWLEQDAIFIGQNSGSDSPLYQVLLINMNSKSHVQARNTRTLSNYLW